MMRSWTRSALIPFFVAGAMAHAQPLEFRLAEEGDWELVKSPEAGTDEATIAEARRELAEGRPGKARDILDEWIELNDGSANALLPQAFRLRGDCKTAQGNEFLALYDYERVIADYSASEEYTTSLERELDIGVRYVNGLKRKVFGLRLFGTKSAGEELLIRVQERLPGSQLAERAGIELADYYYRERDLKMASIAYDLFLQLYPRSPHAKKALKRRIYSIIARYKGPAYDGSALEDAAVLVKRFSSLYPQEAERSGLDQSLLNRLDESAAAQKLVQARWYLKRSEEVSARYIMRRLVREHPLTASAATSLQMMQDRGWIADDLEPSADDEQPTDADEAAPTLEVAP